MRNPYETIQFDEDNRVSAYYEEGSYTYEEICGDGFGIQTLGIARGYNNVSTNDGGAEIVERITDSINYYSHPRDYRELQERALTLVAHKAGLAVEFVTLQGYSQGEWANVVVYCPLDEAEYLKYRIEDLKKWWRGDIFTLVHEKRTVYTSPSGDTLDVWDTEDSIGGIMADSIEEFTEIAKDTFAL